MKSCRDSLRRWTDEEVADQELELGLEIGVQVVLPGMPSS